MKYVLILTILMVQLASCKNSPKDALNTSVSPPSASSPTLPTLPAEKHKYIFENATYTDYIFHNLPFSISQDSKDGVQSNIAMISTKSPINFSKSCPSLGREFFHVDGEIVLEAEVYFDINSGCGAYIFYVDKKATYINDISENGRKFYTNLLKQNFQQ